MSLSSFDELLGKAMYGIPGLLVQFLVSYIVNSVFVGFRS